MACLGRPTSDYRPPGPLARVSTAVATLPSACTAGAVPRHPR